ncbi:MAG: geranylgeranyl pyrophosphate synthase [Paraglaciecola psychrophila]|jgi:geranylgeranyl pyrophosphate synthase
MSESFAELLHRSTTDIDQDLRRHFGATDSPFAEVDSSHYLSRLRQALQYSVLNGGKRIRPLLVHAAAAAVGTTERSEDLAMAASAVEMLHSYSLIHDDLPAMDDDDLRRGQPTCHRAFDEATAILAGDALHSRAFELLTELPTCSATTALKLVALLATAAGPRGMVGGQAIDLASVGQHIDEIQLETLHRLKTGALIRASVALGGTIAGASAAQLRDLDHYGEAIGLAFQVQDDILDIEADTATLGKTQGQDRALNKPTYPSILGMDGAKAKLLALHRQADDALAGFGRDAQLLRQLSDFIVARGH